MFWKTGKPGSTEASRQGAGRSSIARRLALLHILAVLVSYTLFGAFFYSKRMGQLEQESFADLSAERASIVAMMGQPDARVLVGYEIRTQQFEPENLRPFIRILDRKGSTLLESPWLGRTIPRGSFPPPGAALRWRSGQGESYLLESFRLPGQLFSGPGGVLQLGVNTHGEKELVGQIRLTLAAFILCGILFAFCCTFFIVRLALKPLNDISLTARNITRNRLDTRIDSSSLPIELVSLVDSFNSMLERLEDSFSRLSHYSANLAHELRTPINNLMIESDITLAKERTPQEYQRVIASSLEEYGRLSWIVDRLLFLARSDLEALELDRRRLDLRSEIDDIFDYYFDSACESGVTLELFGNAVLCADQTLFRRAISNLISNAIAYTPIGGAIVVTLEQGDDLSVSVTVSDTGRGIDEGHLPSVFDRFYRGAGSKEGNPSGAGLGLAIVKAIMQMHGGSVAVESAPGKGTRLTLLFPGGAAPMVQPGFNDIL